MEENISLQSTLEQLRSFVDSPIWSDLKREVQIWLDDIRNQLEGENNVEISRRLQGNAEACRYFLSLPDTLIEAMELSNGRSERFRSEPIRDNERE